MKNIIGIQQVGVGVPDVQEAFSYYRKVFGMDIPVFQESAEAKLMTKYTGGKVQSRSAILAINIQGGSGFEIWQYTSRKTEKASFDVKLGDYGLFISRIKSRDVDATYADLKSKGVNVLSDVQLAPNGEKHFYVKDIYDNIFEIVEGRDWFRNYKGTTGGICGGLIGVSNMEKSLDFYSKVLGYDKIEYDVTDVFGDFQFLPNGKAKFRRVLLSKKVENSGNFSQLLGSSQIELVQLVEGGGRKIFENRFWGDWGFIHLCFDVYNMKTLENTLAEKGYPFTLQSDPSFDMGEASGHFAYCEDPDGYWIEFVETYRIPILKKIGWYLNLGSKDRTKPLPSWMLATMAFSRVKD